MIYNTGTISVNQNSLNIFGNGTTWSTSVQANQFIRINSFWFQISQVINDTTLLLYANYSGASITNVGYIIASYPQTTLPTTGPTGPTGLQGPQGNIGATGPTGNPGTIGIKGSVATSASLPSTNNKLSDAYLSLDTTSLWVYTNSTASGNVNGFDNVGKISGPTGPTGLQGVTGPISTVAGPTGPKYSYSYLAQSTASFVVIQSGSAYLCDTASGSFTVNLPAFPKVGDFIAFRDFNGTWSSNPLTINPANNSIQSVSGIFVADVSNAGFDLIFVNQTVGWNLQLAATGQAISGPTGPTGPSSIGPTGMPGTTGPIGATGATGPAGLGSTQSVSPQDFGAIGDGNNDDTAALIQAFNSGKKVSLRGKYKVTSLINITLNSAIGGLSVSGAGRGLSQILLSTSTATITFNISDTSSPFGLSEQIVLRDFVIVPTTVINGYALTINAPASSGSKESSFVIENVNLLPSSQTAYSQNGFLFNNCRNSTISSSTIEGQYGLYSGYGITWTGSSNSVPIGLHMKDCSPSWWSYGLNLQGNTNGVTTGSNDWRGIYIKNCKFIGNDYGIYATTVDGLSDSLFVDSCHFNFRTRGFYSMNVKRTFISNCFALCGADTGVVGNSACGIDVNMNNNQINCGFINNIFIDYENSPDVGTRIGVNVSANGQSGIMGCTVSNITTYASTITANIDSKNYTNGGINRIG